MVYPRSGGRLELSRCGVSWNTRRLARMTRVGHPVSDVAAPAAKGIADIAPRSSEKEDHCYVKPFIGTLRVPNPARQSRASSRKQVLRGGGATLPAKRRQRDQTLCD
jgi:hypothetical protein